MNTHARLVPALTLLAAIALAAQQAPPAQPQQPRFRAGTNLVRIDAYVTADGKPVTDLTAEDFEVLEDNVHQRIESFELVTPRPPGPVDERREPNTVAESRAMAADPDARVFVIFMDVWHVQLEGSYRAQAPVMTLLNRVIGQDDLVGVMTPEMSARNLTLARRPEAIEAIFKDYWYWGQRARVNQIDPRDEAIRRCYPGNDTLANEIIRRRREAETLGSLEHLIVHLEGLREERKFVLVLTEGWGLGNPDTRLADTASAPPPPPAIGTNPGGRLVVDPDRGSGSLGACERERAMLAFTDLSTMFRDLIQRANRANVSFYPMDPRGLVAYDAPIGPDAPPPPSVDRARLRARQDAMRELAENSDGFVILDTNATGRALERMLEDTGSYYLLGYYSTNTRLDGRYRKLTVRVKRPGVDVRARPGYRAATEAEVASARVDALMNGAPPGHMTTPTVVSRALERLAPARASVPLRVQAAASAAQIWMTGELDPEALDSDEWKRGGRVRVEFDHSMGAAAPTQAEVALEPGQRAFKVTTPAQATLAPGRYVIRIAAMPADGRLPLQTTAEVLVPETGLLLSETGLVSRRGPSTGLAYLPTADARFRRTERIRFEVPRGDGDRTATARLLGRDGKPLEIALTVSERVDDTTKQRLVVVDATLAPLAQGEYVLEVTLERGDQTDTAAYAFRLVP